MEYALLIGITLAAIAFVVSRLTNAKSQPTTAAIEGKKQELAKQEEVTREALQDYNKKRSDFIRTYGKPDDGGPGGSGT